jgi:hypothetical protein
VYSLNPALTEMLANERAADLNREAASSLRVGPKSRRPSSVRTAAGWAMVEIGLRLAVPGRRIVRGHVSTDRVAMGGGAGIVAR